MWRSSRAGSDGVTPQYYCSVVDSACESDAGEWLLEDLGRLLSTKLPPGGHRGNRMLSRPHSECRRSCVDPSQVSHVSPICDPGNKSGVGEGGLVVEVVVWTESEERERWWREIVGIAPFEDRRVARDVGDLPCAKDSTASAGTNGSPLRFAA